MTIDDTDRAAIEAIVARQCAAWGVGDAIAFCADATDDVVFTNIMGMFSVGRAPFIGQHVHIFGSFYKGSRLEQEIVAITAIRADVAIVDTLTHVSDAPMHPPCVVPIEGQVQTRLEQVLVRNDGVWQVAAFHNVAVYPLPPGAPR